MKIFIFFSLKFLQMKLTIVVAVITAIVQGVPIHASEGVASIMGSIAGLAIVGAGN